MNIKAKRPIRLLLTCIGLSSILSVLLPVCKNRKVNSEKDLQYEKTRGDRYYGGIFRYNESEAFNHIFPHAIMDAAGARISTQVYEGLLRLDPETLALRPALAQKWEVDTSGMLYTFYLRPGIYYHTDACFGEAARRELTAKDFKFSFELLCTAHASNRNFNHTFRDVIKGATAFYEQQPNRSGKVPNEVKGIRVLDAHTLQIELTRPCHPFLFILASPYTAVIPPEAFETYGYEAYVGTGAFQVETLEQDKQVVLVRNPDYYRFDQYGNKLPFLNKIKVTFLKEKGEEVKAFRNGRLDMVYQLSTDSIIEVIESENRNGTNYINQRTPEMTVQYYAFNNQHPAFSDKRVRQAFNYAIDRRHIVEKVLKGDAFTAGHHGITPPAIPHYAAKKVKGYHFNPKKAQQMLEQAGYPNGANFPELTLDVNPGGGRHLKVAREVKRQLKEHLGIKIHLNPLTLTRKVKQSRKGQSVFWRSGWIADYPHPQNFLALLYGKNVPPEADAPSYPNTARYQNEIFDLHYQKGLTALERQESYQHFLRAEQRAMDDAPVIVLWYDESYRLLQPYVRNFPNNAMEHRNFSQVFIDFEEMLKDRKDEEKEPD